MFLAAAGQQQVSTAAAAQPGNAAERARRHIEAASSVVARTIGEAFGACMGKQASRSKNIARSWNLL